MKNAKSLLLLLLALLAACGGDIVVDSGAGDRSSPPPDKSNWIAVSITVDGEPRELVEGTELQINFDGTRIGASAGCNLISGNFALSDFGTLTVSDLFATERGCDAARHDQDEFVSRFLAMGPAFNVVSPDSIQMRTEGIVIDLVDEAVANPPLPLLGTQWEIETFFDVSVASSFNVETPGRIQFTNDSTAVGSDGCADFVIGVDLSEDTTQPTGTVQFAGTLDEAPTECGDIAYAARVSTSIRGQVSYMIEADLLTLTASNGEGIQFRAS